MTLDDFRAALAAHGGRADIWLVYIEDHYETLFSGVGVRLRLAGAFWTRGEAYSCAYRAHGETSRHHAYVFRLAADAQWAASGSSRVAELETVITTASNGRDVAVTAADVAAVMEG